LRAGLDAVQAFVTMTLFHQSAGPPISNIRPARASGFKACERAEISVYLQTSTIGPAGRGGLGQQPMCNNQKVAALVLVMNRASMVIDGRPSNGQGHIAHPARTRRSASRVDLINKTARCNRSPRHCRVVE